MKIIKTVDVAVNEAVKTLKNGGLVVYPTETLYGIGADAKNPEAIKRLTEYKNRPFGKPYSVAVVNTKMAEDYVELNETARNLYREFLPGPLTVISKGRHILAPGVESEEGTLGIRIPSYKLVTDIVEGLGRPITSTSANASYKKRPYKVADILENISDKQKELIDLIIDAGTLPPNEPSTVIDTTIDDPVILRQGEIKLTDKNEVLSRNEENTMNIAKEIWQKYESHKRSRAIVFALQGEMGAGKTIFTKGLAKAMGITELITSPTYNLIHSYPPLTHIDAWRLEKSDDLLSLGFEDLIKNKEVLAIEWAERVSDIIREFDDEAIIIWIKIAFAKKENERLINWGVEK